MTSLSVNKWYLIRRKARGHFCMKHFIYTKNHYFHCVHNRPIRLDMSNSFKFGCFGLVRWWHDALQPLVRIALFLPASWPIHWQFFGFNHQQLLLENLSVTPCFAFFACQCFISHSRSNIFILAYSAPVALSEVG